MKKNQKALENSKKLLDRIENYFIKTSSPSPVNDIIELCKSIGIALIPAEGKKITFTDSYQDPERINNVFGTYAEWKDNETPTIYFNKAYLEDYLHFDSAHEIGHLVGNYQSPLFFEEDSNPSQISYSESLADAFAIELLLPTQYFTHVMGNFHLKEIFRQIKRLSMVTLVHRIFHKLKKDAFCMFFFPEDNEVIPVILKAPVTFPYSKDAERRTITMPILRASFEGFHLLNDSPNVGHGAILSAENLQYKVALPPTLDDYLNKYSLRERAFSVYERGSEDYFALEFPLKVTANEDPFEYQMSGQFFVMLYPFTFWWLQGGQKKAVLLMGIQDKDGKMMELVKAGEDVTIAKQFIPEYADDKVNFDIYGWLNELRRRSAWDHKNFEETNGAAPKIPLPQSPIMFSCPRLS